jgi:hypothetical protein
VDLSGGALQVLGTPRLVDNAGFLVRDTAGNAVSGKVTYQGQPVFSQQPAALAPCDSACTAGLDIAPKLIAEMWKNRSVV